MNKNNKITLFIGSLTGGGAERVTCNLANYLYEHNYEVTVITMSDIKDTYILNDKIKRVYLLHKAERKNPIKDNILRERRLKQYIMDNQDIDCYVAMLPITIFMLVRLRKYIKGKIIISERNNPGSYKLYEKAIMRYAEKRCDGLVVQTKKIGEWYKHFKNMVVIPNAINDSFKNIKRQEPKKKIVAVGRLEKQKNYPMLIKAFAIFEKKHPDYILEIYGRGSQETYIKKLIGKYNLDKKIILKGYVDNIAENIADAALYVMTSDFEGMPNSLIEAMCIGLPCVSTDCDGGGAAELIENNENGILIAKKDVNGFANAMDEIISNQEFAKKIGSNATKLKSSLSYDEIYSKWEEYITLILTNR